MKKLLVFLWLTLPLFVQAQSDSLASYWNVTLHVGAFISGVPKHLEEAMRSNGFGHTDNGFLGSTQHPISSEPPILQVGVERILQKGWSGKLVLSSLRGNVYGYSMVHSYFDFKYRLTTTAFLIGYHSKQRITRIAFGPALNVSQVKTDRLIFSPATAHEKSAITDLQVGVLLEAGVRFPAKSRLFLDFHTQYQLVGKQDFGTYPFQSTDIIGQSHRVTFQAGRKSLSYLSINFGLGVRIGKPLK